MKTKVALTVKGLENAKPDPNGRYEKGDANLPGFYLSVMPSGHKSFVYRYRFNGESRKLTVGIRPQNTLAQAHQKAREAIGEISKGYRPRGGKGGFPASWRVVR